MARGRRHDDVPPQTTTDSAPGQNSVTAAESGLHRPPLSVSQRVGTSSPASMKDEASLLAEARQRRRRKTKILSFVLLALTVFALAIVVGVCAGVGLMKTPKTLLPSFPGLPS